MPLMRQLLRTAALSEDVISTVPCTYYDDEDSHTQGPRRRGRGRKGRGRGRGRGRGGGRGRTVLHTIVDPYVSGLHYLAQ